MSEYENDCYGCEVGAHFDGHSCRDDELIDRILIIIKSNSNLFKIVDEIESMKN